MILTTDYEWITFLRMNLWLPGGYGFLCDGTGVGSHWVQCHLPSLVSPPPYGATKTTKKAMVEAVKRGNMISWMCSSSSLRHCCFLLTKPLGFWTSNCMLAGIPSHFVCFPVTETGLCTNTSVVLSLQTERTTSKPSGADTNTFPSRWSTQPQPPASPFSCLW